jgi:hypothetical protein
MKKQLLSFILFAAASTIVSAAEVSVSVYGADASLIHSYRGEPKRLEFKHGADSYIVDVFAVPAKAGRGTAVALALMGDAEIARSFGESRFIEATLEDRRARVIVDTKPEAK